MKQMASAALCAFAITAGFAGPAQSAACQVHLQTTSFKQLPNCTTNQNGDVWNVFDRDGSGACLGWKCSNPGKQDCGDSTKCGEAP